MSLWWQFEAALFTTIYTNRVAHVLGVFWIVSYLYVEFSLCFGHIFTVSSRCYGRCYVNKLIPLSTFLKCHTHLDENPIRSFQNVFDKASKVLILVFLRNWIFHQHRHILGYHTPLNSDSNVELGHFFLFVGDKSSSLSSWPDFVLVIYFFYQFTKHNKILEGQFIVHNNA